MARFGAWLNALLTSLCSQFRYGSFGNSPLAPDARAAQLARCQKAPQSWARQLEPLRRLFHSQKHFH
jgi:hypothetical protein